MTKGKRMKRKSRPVPKDTNWERDYRLWRAAAVRRLGGVK